MSTTLDLVKGSLRLLGVLASGEAPDASDAADALSSLNMMLGGWNTNKLLVLGIDFEEFELAVGQQSYTLGAGGDFDTTVPVFTKSVWLKDYNDIQRPIKLVDSDYWGRLQYMELEGNYPQYAYIDYNHPLRKIYFYPTPNRIRTVVLQNFRQFGSITSLTNELVVPQGYDRSIKYNLAIELAPEYGKNISPEIDRIARKSFADIKRANIVPTIVGVDPFLVRRNDLTPLSGVADPGVTNPFYFGDFTNPQDGDARIVNQNGGMYFQIYDSATETWNQVGAMYE